MAGIGASPRMQAYFFENWQFTFNLAAGITVADVGKAVALDTGAATKVKLAGDEDDIIGRLEVVEDRTQEGVLIGTVALKFANRLPVKTGLTGNYVVAIGSTVVGAGSGEVKARVVSSSIANDKSMNYVTYVTTGSCTVVKV